MTQKQENLILQGITLKLTLVLKLTMRQSKKICLKHQWVGVSINTNTNNKSRSTMIPAPKVATQQREIAWRQHTKRVKARNFQTEARLLLRKILPNDDFKKKVRRE